MRDMVIIGGGPGGLSAGIYAVRAGLDVVLYERGAVGGYLLNAADVDNYPGFPKGISGPDLIQQMDEHARKVGLQIEFDEIHEIIPEEGSFKLRLRNREISSRTVVLATGTGPRPLGLENEEKLRGRGVSYCAVCDGAFFRDEPVAVVGGGDSAAEEALFLARTASKVYLIHTRGDVQSTRFERQGIKDNPKIEIIPNSEVVAINGEEAVEGVEIREKDTGETQSLSVKALFIYVGVKPNSYLVEKHVDLDPRGFILVDEYMRTPVQGLFAVGDVRRTPLRQVVTAVSDGAIAAVWAEKYLSFMGQFGKR